MSSTLTRITIFFSMLSQYVPIIQKYLPQSRVDHSIRVAETSATLAERYHANVGVAQIAGIFHDIAKAQHPQSLLAMGVSNSYPEVWDEFPSVWHALAGPEILAMECPNEFQSSYSAMKWHTTGAANMCLESAIVFVADFIEPGRNHPMRSIIHDVALTDLNQAVALVTKCSVDKLNGLKKPIHPWTLECWDYYKRFMPSASQRAV